MVFSLLALVMHKYTFLIPAYKSKFLNETLRSIKNQRFPDFEVIVSDDNSPEDLFSIVIPYLDDSRYHYRRNEINIGGNNLVSHWNLLVDLCETDYCIMAGDDDVYDECFLERIDTLASSLMALTCLASSFLRSSVSSGITIRIVSPSLLGL